jgi:hypothetical protein
VHLDLHVEDPRAAHAEAIALGARGRSAFVAEQWGPTSSGTDE